jgi:GNAT superfamily N-acetyltransferase
MITVTDSQDAELEAVVKTGLADYNEQKSGRRDWRPLKIAVRAPETGALVGGLLGRTSLGLFFVDLFYLPESLRGAGLGRRILRLAEEEAVCRGCRAATLVTIGFQAPQFYRREGWEEFGRIATGPDVERIFMKKTLVR